MREAPHLVEMQETYGPKGLKVIGITKAGFEETAEFRRDRGINYWLVPDAETDQLAYGVKLVWGTRYFLVDPRGTIVSQDRGAIERRLAAELG